jgi:hypothetical protein
MPVGWYMYVAIAISSIALFVAVRNYQRKAGVYLRGTFCIASSRACEDRYVSEVVLENLKDRAVSIFGIYLRVGYSVYIQIESFEDKPLILKPFELYQNRFGPIEFYGFNMRKVDVNSLLAKDTIKKRLVLSTSTGKYFVPEPIRRWNPLIEHFDNHLTAILRPIPSRFKSTDLGGNIRYVVEITSIGGATEIVPIGKDDHDIKVFKNFRLTGESLLSKEALELYLLEQQIAGALACTEFEVHDIDVWRKEVNEHYMSTVSVTEDSFVRYHLVGRIGTWLSNWSTKRRNRKLRKGDRK